MEDNYYSHECRIRDFYASRLSDSNPDHALLKTEGGYEQSNLRADLRTVTENNTLWEWEFKLEADYRALGQILTYVALARRQYHPKRVRGIIAAFRFQKDFEFVVESMNLGIELIQIPSWMRKAGKVPTSGSITIPSIPRLVGGLC